MSCKKIIKLEEEEQWFCDYFGNIPDELMMLIFMKLGNGSGEDTLKDVKLLGQLSTLCKRFNSLTCLIPTLFVSHPSITLLHECCPKILNKFKHISSLRIEYQSDSKGVMSDLSINVPYIYSKATYNNDSTYSLAVIRCTNYYVYTGQHENYPYPLFETSHSIRYENDVVHTTQRYISALFHLHHMLFSSIRDHKLLQSVVVTDFLQRESFTLVEQQLVELRDNDIIMTNRAQLHGGYRGTHVGSLNLPLSESEGIIVKNVTYCLFTRLMENSTHDIDKDYIPQLDGSGKLLQKPLEVMLGMLSPSIRTVHYETIPKILFKSGLN